MVKVQHGQFQVAITIQVPCPPFVGPTGACLFLEIVNGFL